MTEYLKITSRQNPRVKEALKLRQRRDRDKSGLTLLEGYRELTRAREYGLVMKECFFCPAMFLGTNEYALLEQLAAAGVAVYEVADHILTQLAYRDRPEGLIATAVMRRHGLADLPVVPQGFYLVCETVEKPGNLGSILRSADAAGVDGMILCDKGTDLYNPNVIRASTGALFSVPLAETSSAEALAWLQANHIAVLAATPHTDTIFTEVDMTRGVAVVVGREQTGLTDYWMNRADLKVVIPMLGKIDSLNVATATTILLYEGARQRQWRRPAWSKGSVVP
ncbi:MAG: RNA methyltransferase [Victivallales bacterium]|nr:RNA methyltransferase [Victivallales bacterium]